MTTSTKTYPMAPPPRPQPQPTTIRRGEVYCDKDFWSRSAAWFVHQQEQLKARQAQLDKIREEQAQKQQQQQQLKAKPAKKTPRWASTATPTRVQPARAAKGKKRYAEEDSEAVEPVQKKVKTLPVPTTIQMPTPSPTPSPSPSPPPEVPVNVNTPSPDYMLDPAWATTSLSTFQAGIDTLLEGKRATLSRSCFWSMSKSMTPPSPSSSLASVNRWCPIVALPLACMDMRYCSHGRSWPPSFVSATAPAAYMSPPPTPPAADAVRFQAKPFAELRHIQERTVSLAGLRFAVDMCNGMLRVYMV